MPKLPLADWVDALIKWMQEYFAPLFHFIQGIITPITDFFERVLSVTPPLVTILLLTLLVWLLSRLRIAVFALVGFLLIYDLGLWETSVETLALVLTSTLISIIIGIPLGLWAGQSDRVKQIVTPVLDFMQTMPAFVYLIPAVFFFALGAVPAVIASVVFAMPPTIRMTSPGLRQVSKELKEGCECFWLHFLATLGQSGDSARETDYPGRNQPNHHAFLIHGGHQFHDWSRRAW